MKQIQSINKTLIKPNKYQPRLVFDDQALKELSSSIKENGLIQPITVRKINDQHYEIIAGERRFRACVLAGFEMIPCVIMSTSDTQAAELAIIENIQREDLSSIEEAKAFVEIMRNSSLTQEKLAKRLGKSQSSVANKIRLLNLPTTIQDAISSKKISERHARALLKLAPKKQEKIFKQVVEKSLNVRQTEHLVETTIGDKEKKHKAKVKGFTRNTQIGINSINQCIEMIKKMGIDVKMEIDDNPQAVVVNIKFPK